MEEGGEGGVGLYCMCIYLYVRVLFTMGRLVGSVGVFLHVHDYRLRYYKDGPMLGGVWVWENGALRELWYKSSINQFMETALVINKLTDLLTDERRAPTGALMYLMTKSLF